jgi:hypothetical protein
LVVGLGTVIGVVASRGGGKSTADSAEAAPLRPPATVCGNTGVLDGPDAPPPGAVSVAPGQDLSLMTNAAPAGTTFWLAPGVHTLSPDPYAQVVPKPGNRYVGSSGAVLDGRRLNRYAFTGSATGVVVEHLTVRNFGKAGQNNNEGVVNHDAGPAWTIRYDTVLDNAGAGVFVGSDNNVSWNCLANNGQYGFSVYRPNGVANVTLDHNEISGNDTDNWEARQPGCGCTGGGKFWATTGARITNNYVHNNSSVGVWADTNNVGFLFSGNYISDNASEGIVYEISYNALIVHNTFVRNGLVKGPTNPSFPTGAIYLSESGSDERVSGPYGASLQVSENTFQDNWSGVVLWENADRFCNSPANTSSGTCTLVGRTASPTYCSAPDIAKAPYYDDCRWKTQNVSVVGNTFSFAPQKIGDTCSTSTSCGQNAIFSNWGSYPAWSPYQGRKIQDAITFDQNNHFDNNTYSGPWTFLAREPGNVLSFSQWQAAPYGQDRDSRLG